MKKKPSIGYIGLGLMGGPMTQHLVKKSYEIHGFDILEKQREAAQAWGVIAHQDLQSTVIGRDLIVLNLPTTAAVEDVVFGDQGIAQVIKPYQCVVDFSTIKVGTGKKLIQKLLQETGCAWVDAPVSGGPMAAGSGTLTVMAGAREQDLPLIQTLMDDVSSQFSVVGLPGSGLVAKMLNQLMVGCLHAVIAETVAVAEGAGIDAALIPQALTGGHADGVAFQLLYPRMLARDHAPRGYVRQLLKDLDMVQDYAGSLKVPTPMTAQAQTLYRMLAHWGHTELDTSAIMKVYDR
ncbi:MAG: NAD(P)-dependent oxidoreductase [Betaproteobacteria bacterium]|jgi:hypothetical protein|nr:NAD(P)-dependent oxidoreductase [Betaproteobacteria bacterium]NBT67934.1 NAD(P)-dependent oxidoreductase [Betaproteobacteria bacterium]NBY07224.1 NAD(P)-dependent oxidoreductase [Betaproteobacteria bacterium]